MADYVVSDTSLASVANAIRAKSGGSGQLIFPDGFVSEVNGIEKGYSLADIIERNYSGNLVYNGSGVLPAGLFLNCTSLVSFSAPNVTKIGGSTSFGYYANTEGQTFKGCTNLESVNMPLLDSLYYAGYAFYNCKKITNWGIDWHRITTLGGGCFKNTSLPSAIAFSKVTSNIYTSAFQDSISLTKLDFANGGEIQANAFNGCNLNVLVLRKSSVEKLNNISAFENTPFGSGNAGGILYVPENLISSY